MTKNFLKIFMAIFIAFAFFSCSDDIVPSPEMEKITDSDSGTRSTLSSPKNIVVSQGGRRSITLTWDAVSKAKRYDIYAAGTPFSTFVQVGETTSNSFSYDNLVPGITRYFKIQAVDYSGQVSDFSSILQGSTLATPIITLVEEDADNSSATIYWWMKNCNSTTYQDSVRFEVRCLASNKSDVTADDVVYGGTESYTFTGLSAATTYYYQVVAYVTSDMAKTEESDFVDMTTAHCLIPNAPVNLEAQKGAAASEISLTWQLPDFVEVNNNSIYENHPVYFKVFRRIKDSTDSYETICDYVGTVNTNPSCVTIESYTGSDVKTSTVYPAYIPLSKVTYVDSEGLSNGKQYEYKVQSYVDDSTDAITSNTLSIATDYGWLCPVPTLQVSAEYTENEEEYTSVGVNFNAEIQNFTGGTEYIYVLEETKTGFETSEKSSYHLKTAESLATINNFKRVFKNPESEAGYYSYKLYVLNSKESVNVDSEYAAKAILSVSSSLKITVTNDKTLIPTIEDFQITEGYSNKFELSWKYDETCTYSLDWTEYNADGNETGTGTYELTSEDVASATNEGIFTFSHPATSGTRRRYMLTADKGLTKSERYEEITETLGTAEPVFASPDYTKITVTWDPVQKADSYKITAYYTDDEGTTANYLVNEDVVCSQDYNTTQFTVTPDNADNPTKYTCVITTPNGYKDSNWSGKPIKFIIKALSSVDSTENETSVCTLGPALIGTIIGAKQANSISVSWNKIEGANGYLIQRSRYSDGAGNATSDLKSDTYYFDGSELSITGEPVSSDCATVTLSDSVYTLTDMYCEQDGSSSYAANQAKISWGLPFGYVVIPVISDSDFEFEGATMLAEDSAVQYENLTASKGATYGYGLGLRAYKAESSSIQKLEWALPYYGSTLTPTVYYRNSGSSENKWTKINANLSIGSTSVSFSPESATASYEYVIAYSKNSTQIELPDSFVTDTNTGLSLATLETSGTNYDYTGVALEKLNKGYLLAVDFSAGYGGTLKDDGTYATDDGKYYSETANWAEWDYSERSIGPSSAYISIKNYNLSSKWSKVATLDKDLHYSSAETWENTTITQNGEVSVNLAPAKVSSAETVTDGTMLNTAGLLMVLRDAKHYYSLTLERGEVSATLGEDDSVYGYRQLSDAELVRIAMLSLERAIVKTGMEDTLTGTVGSGAKYIDGYSGTFGWSQDSSSKFNWYIVDYVADFTSAPGKSATIPCIISLSDPNTGSSGNRRGRKYGKTIKFFCYDETSSFSSSKLITIGLSPSSAYDITLDSYTADLKFAVSSSTFAAQIVRNGTTTSTVSATSSESVKRWCPINIDGNGHNEENSTYGWWPTSE